MGPSGTELEGGEENWKHSKNNEANRPQSPYFSCLSWNGREQRITIIYLLFCSEFKISGASIFVGLFAKPAGVSQFANSFTFSRFQSADGVSRVNIDCFSG